MSTEFENINIFELKPNNTYDQHCAEIFITIDKLFVFHCSLCSEKYTNFETLAEHILGYHYSYEDSTAEILDDICEDIQDDFNDLIEQVEESSAEDEVQHEEKRLDYEFVDLGRKSDKSQHDQQTITNVTRKQLSTLPAISDVSMKPFTKNEQLSITELQTPINQLHQNTLLKHKKETVTTKVGSNISSATSHDARNISSTKVNSQTIELEAMMKKLQEKIAAMRKKKATTPAKVMAVKQIEAPPRTKISKTRIPVTTHNGRWSAVEVQDMMDHLQQKNLSRERKVQILRMITNDFYTCTFCDRKFRTKNMLKYHLIIHSDVRPFKCKYCERTFKTFSSVNAHQRRHTGIKDHDCSFCPKQFYTSHELEAHEKGVHTGERDYICPKCGLGFITSGILSKHMIRHSNVRPHKCEHCGKAFFRRDLLKKHLYVHSDVRDHVCSVCNASFVRPRSLTLHMKIHTNAREYNCDLCSSAFNQKQSLLAHKKSRHQVLSAASMTVLPQNRGIVEGITLCLQCNIKFVDAATLLEHKQLVHNEQNEHVSISN